MTRLFVRFYLGVLFVLFSAAVVQNVITQRQNDSHNVEVVEAALSGGVRLARDTFSAFPQIERTELLQAVQSRFAYPVTIMQMADIPDNVAARLRSGRDVVFHVDKKSGKGMLKTSLAETNEVLSFGPLPEFARPSRLALFIGLIVVLAVTAIAIGLLLRPVARQFRLIEATAMQLASGDFSARVDEQKVASTRELAKAINYMASRTETLLRTQRELLQAVSHELRTPLSRIAFSVDLIRTAKNDEERDIRLVAVEDSTEELNDLVGELLGYVRMETSEAPLNVTEIELQTLVQELIHKYAPLHPGKTFESDASVSTASAKIVADRARMERALGNLLNNAGRHAAKHVRICYSESADWQQILVDDDGPGIADADREQIFEPFVRLSQTEGGAGLGLAIVRRIVTQHGGEASAESSDHGGCRMRFALPRRNSL